MRERQYLQCLHHGLLLDLEKKCSVPGVSRPKDIEEDSLWSLNEPLNQSIPIVLPIDDATKIKLMDGWHFFFLLYVVLINLVWHASYLDYLSKI